jgi:hypothetical protein
MTTQFKSEVDLALESIKLKDRIQIIYEINDRARMQCNIGTDVILNFEYDIYHVEATVNVDYSFCDGDSDTPDNEKWDVEITGLKIS